LISNDLWSKNANHANQLAKRLEKGFRQFSAIQITQKVDANGIFAIMPPAIIPKLQEHGFFYVWNDKTNEVRLMCSWDTTENDVDTFINQVGIALQSL
jgi:threonine aldolase